MRRTIRLLLRIGLLPAVLLAAVPPGLADDLGGSVMRDCPVSLTIPQGRLEVNLDYLVIRSDWDWFSDITEDEDRQTAAGPGDLDGARVLINYGLFRSTTLKGEAQHRGIEFGSDKLGITSFGLGVKQNLIDKRGSVLPKVALDVGVAWDQAEDKGFDIRNAAGDAVVGRLMYQGASDWTASARLTAGWIWGSLFPNFFAEYGHTRIEGGAALQSADPPGSVPLPDLLERSEDYFKGGLSLLIKFPFRALLQLEYHCLLLLRDEDGDAPDWTKYNNIFKADFNYYLTRALIVHIGAVYLQHQFNGVIPLLYNGYTQDGFDRDYGYFSVGLSYLFDF